MYGWSDSPGYVSSCGYALARNPTSSDLERPEWTSDHPVPVLICFPVEAAQSKVPADTRRSPGCVPCRGDGTCTAGAPRHAVGGGPPGGPSRVAEPASSAADTNGVPTPNVPALTIGRLSALLACTVDAAGNGADRLTADPLPCRHVRAHLQRHDPHPLRDLHRQRGRPPAGRDGPTRAGSGARDRAPEPPPAAAPRPGRRGRDRRPRGVAAGGRPHGAPGGPGGGPGGARGRAARRDQRLHLRGGRRPGPSGR